MVINVDITEYRAPVTAYEVGLAGNRSGAKLLKERYSSAWFSSPQSQSKQLDVTPSAGFQKLVDKYAEVTTHDPWSDVTLYFQRLSSGPLRFPILNTAAMAAASEAIAGWFCETSHPWGLLLRPPRVTPDLIFMDTATGRWVLVEVKATARPHLGTKSTTDLDKIASQPIELTGTSKGNRHCSGDHSSSERSIVGEAAIRRSGGAIMTRSPDPIDALMSGDVSKAVEAYTSLLADAVEQGM